MALQNTPPTKMENMIYGGTSEYYPPNRWWLEGGILIPVIANSGDYKSGVHPKNRDMFNTLYDNTVLSSPILSENVTTPTTSYYWG